MIIEFIVDAMVLLGRKTETPENTGLLSYETEVYTWFVPLKRKNFDAEK